MLAVGQGENAALTVRRPDVLKGQGGSHDCEAGLKMPEQVCKGAKSVMLRV